MMEVRVQIRNLDQLRANFRKAPATTLKYLSRATTASLAEVEKQAIDRNFQFKHPIPPRTGKLAQSFALGKKISTSGLQASIGPTARNKGYYYPAAVYYGWGQKANKYMDRIADAAQPSIQKHFEDAMDRIVTNIAKT